MVKYKSTMIVCSRSRLIWGKAVTITLTGPTSMSSTPSTIEVEMDDVSESDLSHLKSSFLLNFQPLTSPILLWFTLRSNHEMAHAHGPRLNALKAAERTQDSRAASVWRDQAIRYPTLKLRTDELERESATGQKDPARLAQHCNGKTASAFFRVLRSQVAIALGMGSALSSP